IYFAIECKRIKSLSDTASYVDDIRKFSERNYKETRLPFEGQLAFVENESLSNDQIKKQINLKLKSHTVVRTKKYLSKINFHPPNNVYYSEHKKNFSKNELFTIYHLFFNYSKIVLN